MSSVSLSFSGEGGGSDDVSYVCGESFSLSFGSGKVEALRTHFIGMIAEFGSLEGDFV